MVLLMATFGEWIFERRMAARLSQTECAKRSGFSVQRWNQIESDDSRKKDGTAPQIRRETAEKISRGLGVDVAEVYAAAGLMPDPAEELDVPPELERVWNKLGDEINRLPAGKARDSIIRAAESNAEALRQMIIARLEEEGEGD